MKKWRCTVCGYIHKGDTPPDKCPVCGADKIKFVPVDETGDPSLPKDGSDFSAQGAPSSHQPAKASGGGRFSRQLTRLHAHPIAVHIPNGVLPASVFFALMAWLFKWPIFDAAAKLNLIFVTVSMPLVIATGIIDWRNRFKGRMTPVFRNKIICAGIVTLISLILSIWWLTQPDILIQSTCAPTFILVLLINLITAAIAGWYGGKLVFPQK